MQEQKLLAAICGLFGIGSLGSVVWAIFISTEGGVERIFIVITGLALAGLFLGMAALTARSLRGSQPSKSEVETAKQATQS